MFHKRFVCISHLKTDFETKSYVVLSILLLLLSFIFLQLFAFLVFLSPAFSATNELFIASSCLFTDLAKRVIQVFWDLIRKFFDRFHLYNAP